MGGCGALTGDLMARSIGYMVGDIGDVVGDGGGVGRGRSGVGGWGSGGGVAGRVRFGGSVCGLVGRVIGDSDMGDGGGAVSGGGAAVSGSVMRREAVRDRSVAILEAGFG